MLDAVVEFEVSQAHDGGEPLLVPDDVRRRAEQALEIHSSIASVVHHCATELVSPQPFVAVEPTSKEERQVCEVAKRVYLPARGQGYARPVLGEAVDAVPLLEDRQTGLALAQAALANSSAIGRLHELFRVIENGFKLANTGLIQPLFKFLQTYPNPALDYRLDEVEAWVKTVRNPATHADRRFSEQVLFDKDVAPFLPRLEQAALDTLFNKRDWHRQNARRRNGVRFATLNGPPETGAILAAARGGELRIDQSLDHFGAFQFDSRCKVGWESVLAPGSIAGLTHFHQDSKE